MRTVALCLATLLVVSAVLVADDHVILTDTDVDYSTFKTFSVAAPAITSERPELKFPALQQTLVEAMTKALTSVGLKETRLPQLTIEATITTIDYSLGSFGRANVVRGGRSGPGGNQQVPVDFSEATLIIDMVREGTHEMVWRGVYHDKEDSGQKLAEALPKDAGILLANFPPKKAVKK